MLRTFDLAMSAQSLETWLNDPYFRMEKCAINCSETGYTTATIQGRRSKERTERKRQRRIERFLIFNGANSRLDELMDDPAIKIIRNLDFVSEQGVIIVLDYEY